MRLIDIIKCLLKQLTSLVICVIATVGAVNTAVGCRRVDNKAD